MPQVRRNDNNLKFIVRVLQGTTVHETVDPVSTHILLLANLNKITNVHVKLSRTTIGPKLPYVTIDGVPITIAAMIKLLEQLGRLNRLLRRREVKKMIHYRRRIRKELEPAVFLHAWYTKQNRDYTIQLRTHGMINPFKIFQRWYLKWKWHSIDRSDNVFLNAIPLLECLEAILNRRTSLLFLSKSSYLDIHVYAYLYHVIIVDYPDKRFKELVQRYAPVLTANVERFAFKYQISNYGSFYANVTHRFDEFRVPRRATVLRRVFRISKITTYFVVTAAVSICTINIWLSRYYCSRNSDN